MLQRACAGQGEQDRMARAGQLESQAPGPAQEGRPGTPLDQDAVSRVPASG